MRDALLSLLPSWARPDHPVLRYELASFRGQGSSRRRFCTTLLIALPLGIGGYLYASGASPANIGDWLWRGLYFPSLLVQVVTGLAAFGCGMAMIDSERGWRAWDHLRVTEVGAGLTLRTRWVAILYRLRAPLLALTLSRLCLALLMLRDLTAFGGVYAHIIAAGQADLFVILPLLSLQFAVTLLLPIVAVGAAAALGMLMSLLIRERLYAICAQVLLSLMYAALSAGLLPLMTMDALPAEGAPGFVIALAYTAVADWGLLHSHLGSISDLWRQIPGGMWLPIASALLLFALAAVIDGMLALAARLAERAE